MCCRFVLCGAAVEFAPVLVMVDRTLARGNSVGATCCVDDDACSLCNE